MKRRIKRRAEAASLVLIWTALACKDGEPAPAARVTRGPASGSVIDLGADEDRAALITGFYSPEAIERRRASWSEGQSSEISFALKGSAPRYLLALLAEPYFAIQPVSVQASVNGADLGSINLEGGWNAYGMLLEPGVAREGDNTLSLRYSKTGRPSSVDPASTDGREISVRVDEIQVQPIMERAQLTFNMHDALVRSSLGQGWAIDASDPMPGIWTQGQKAVVNLILEPLAGKDYSLELTAHSQGGVADQSVLLQLNQTALGLLTFAQRKSTQRVVVPAAALRDRNELVLEIKDPKSPAQIDPKSDDQRPLGLRIMKLVLVPQPQTQAQAPTQPASAAQ